MKNNFLFLSLIGGPKHPLNARTSLSPVLDDFNKHQTQEILIRVDFFCAFLKNNTFFEALKFISSTY